MNVPLTGILILSVFSFSRSGRYSQRRIGRSIHSSGRVIHPYSNSDEENVAALLFSETGASGSVQLERPVTTLTTSSANVSSGFRRPSLKTGIRCHPDQSKFGWEMTVAEAGDRAAEVAAAVGGAAGGSAAKEPLGSCARQSKARQTAVRIMTGLLGQAA